MHKWLSSDTIPILNMLSMSNSKSFGITVFGSFIIDLNYAYDAFTSVAVAESNA
jgi:hypothetical protein